VPRTQFDVHGLTVELRAHKEDDYEVLHAAARIGSVTFCRVEDKPRWFCSCGDYDAVRVQGVLAHLVGSHTTLSHRPLLPASATSNHPTFTYLRLVGHHPDPTADEALRRLYRHPW
jgi:hypothetical protein